MILFLVITLGVAAVISTAFLLQAIFSPSPMPPDSQLPDFLANWLKWADELRVKAGKKFGRVAEWVTIWLLGILMTSPVIATIVFLFYAAVSQSQPV